MGSVLVPRQLSAWARAVVFTGEAALTLKEAVVGTRLGGGKPRMLCPRVWLGPLAEYNSDARGGMLLKLTFLFLGVKEGILWKRGRDNGQFLPRKFLLSEREGCLKYFTKQDVSTVDNSHLIAYSTSGSDVMEMCLSLMCVSEISLLTRARDDKREMCHRGGVPLQLPG